MSIQSETTENLLIKNVELQTKIDSIRAIIVCSYGMPCDQSLLDDLLTIIDRKAG